MSLGHQVSSPHSLVEPESCGPDVEENSSKMGWYLVYTKARLEQQAFSNLEQQGYHCYLPKLVVEKFRFRRAVIIVEPMFARYLFIQLSNELTGKSWGPIRSTPGVSHLVCFGNSPAKISSQLIEILRKNEEEIPVVSLFNQGEAVSAVEGPFAGIQGLYQTLDADRRAIILLEILGKQVAIKIEGARLRKIG